jgi:hypothetical protein
MPQRNMHEGESGYVLFKLAMFFFFGRNEDAGALLGGGMGQGGVMVGWLDGS